MKHRNAPAKALESPLFRQRVVDSRKKKHLGYLTLKYIMVCCTSERTAGP
jgi:hypothetical protein